jgi:hypothetical protein
LPFNDQEIKARVFRLCKVEECQASTQCGKTNSKSERYAYATSAAQMSCGTECITKLPLLRCGSDGGRKIDVRVVAGDRNTYPPHSHTPCCTLPSAGDSHKAQLPINCIRRFHCAAHALVFASLERRSLSLSLSRSYTSMCAYTCSQDQSAPCVSIHSGQHQPTHPHWQTEEETMSRKRPLIVDDQQ